MGAFDDNHLHGVASRAELLAAGVGRRAIEHRLATGRLHRRYPGVYAVGRPDLLVSGERRAAVLACGDSAVLSHRSAAGAWGLRPDGGARWEVTVQGTGKPAPDQRIRVYRHRLAGDETTMLDGIAATSVARTLRDLATVLRPHQLRRAIERADQLELLDMVSLRVQLERHRGRPGTPALRDLVEDLDRHGVTHTRSDPEALLLQVCIDHGLPRPEVNRYDGRREPDFRWPGARLVVEVDGWAFHRGRPAFERDRARDRQLLREGWRVARFPAGDLSHRPTAVAHELRALLVVR